MAQAKSRLEELYRTKIRQELKKTLKLDNIMEAPGLSKIVLNVGVKDAISDSKILQSVETALTKIVGQKPVRTVARKSIAGFKLREGMPIGVMVTLRGQRMYEFLDKLINLALPEVKDFQGVPRKLDGRGSYNLGIKEWTIFPEIEYNVGDKVYGVNVTIQTTAKNDERARALLEAFGMPFRS
jgi:large subunit ribosomal protein L5